MLIFQINFDNLLIILLQNIAETRILLFHFLILFKITNVIIIN